MVIKKMTTTNKKDQELTKKFRQAVKLEIARKKVLGTPIAKYDTKKKQAYLVYANGKKEYAAKKE